MPKYIVTKTLALQFECEADTPQEAEEQCINADDSGPDFTLLDCQYEVEEQA